MVLYLRSWICADAGLAGSVDARSCSSASCCEVGIVDIDVGVNELEVCYCSYYFRH